MRKTIFNVGKLLIIFLFLGACSSVELGKVRPEYVGVDPRVKTQLDEYKWLSAQNHIEFDDTVTIGFKNINNGNVIGVCNYGLNFREIDVDLSYWNHSSKMSHLSLLFHELSHCYCGRDHDYGKNLLYPKTEAARIERALLWKVEGGPRPGYWDDGCPVSLMYPVLVDDDCMQEHYNEYIKEMFDRCDPW